MMETEALTATDQTDLLPEVGDHLEDQAADLCQLMIDEGRLREMGLINQDYDKNPVIWMQKQLEKLFGPQVN